MQFAEPLHRVLRQPMGHLFAETATEEGLRRFEDCSLRGGEFHGSLHPW